MDGWKNIDENTPKNGYILLAGKYKNSDRWWFKEGFNDNDEWFDVHLYKILSPIKWIELPKE